VFIADYPNSRVLIMNSTNLTTPAATLTPLYTWSNNRFFVQHIAVDSIGQFVYATDSSAKRVSVLPSPLYTAPIQSSTGSSTVVPSSSSSSSGEYFEHQSDDITIIIIIIVMIIIVILITGLFIYFLLRCKRQRASQNDLGESFQEKLLIDGKQDL